MLLFPFPFLNRQNSVAIRWIHAAWGLFITEVIINCPPIQESSYFLFTFCRRLSMARIKRVPKKSTSLTSTENVVHNISRTYKSLHNLQLQSKITGGIKKPHPWKPSLGVLLDIRRYQRTTSLLIPKLSFQRIVRSLTDSNFKGIKFQTQALHALQVGLTFFFSIFFFLI